MSKNEKMMIYSFIEDKYRASMKGFNQGLTLGIFAGIAIGALICELFRHSL